MNKLFSFLLFLCSIPLLSQYQFQRLNHIRNLRSNAILYNLDVDVHTSVQPINLWELDSISKGGSESWEQALSFNKTKWLGRKAFDEHLVDVRGKDYWFTIDPVVNFQVGKEIDSETKYVNTRGFTLEGKLGKKVTFTSSFLENQAKLPSYVASYALYNEVVPGQGKQRPYNGTGFDFSMASGEVTITPDNIFSITFGQGRNFFGEGYRSMFVSDAAYNYPFLRLETKFWKIKYTNLWAQMYDIRPEAQVSTNGGYAKKYLSTHYLSININSRWNISFFEAIIVGDTAQQQGPDISFFNPVIFYRPIEFSVGSRTGNAHLGVASSFKIADGLQTYGQFIMDEFDISELLDANGYWANKYSWQLGIKYYNAFGIQGLFGRMEYNGVRPYTNSHVNALTNYGHYSQSIAHPWGANFQEGLVQVIYQPNRWEFECRVHLGIMGLDKDSSDWGGDIYIPNSQREQDYGNEIGQGIKGMYSYVWLRSAWLVNPASGLKIEAGAQLRGLSGEAGTTPISTGNSNYYFVGLRTEFFNNYYDF